MPPLIDLTDKNYERLTVLRLAYITRQGASWECLCSCGNTVVVMSSALLRGRTKSCGCLQRERTAQANTTHGHARVGHNTLTYSSWRSMIQRCEDTNCSTYKYYGEIGIAVCSRWRESFSNFLEDMGERPSAKYTIHRKKNSLGYSKENCSWATKEEQIAHRVCTVRLTFQGVTRSLAAWSRELNIPYHVLWRRRRRGMPVETILSPWSL
jgi:hypothetical protein